MSVLLTAKYRTLSCRRLAGELFVGWRGRWRDANIKQTELVSGNAIQRGAEAVQVAEILPETLALEMA